MRTTQEISVFLASPSDVQAEREIARQVLEDINRTIGRQKGLHFAVVGWETDAYPVFGTDGQQVLNQQIGDMAQYDMFVGIMWNKFGSPTPRADSGTAEEFERAVSSLDQTGKPAIMFYFKTEPSSPSSTKEAEQKVKVMAFRESLYPRGLIGDFKDAADFGRKFRQHIEQQLATYNVETPAPPSTPQVDKMNLPTIAAAASATAKSNQPNVVASGQTVVSDSGMWIFLNNRYSQVDSVNEMEDGSLAINVSSTSAEDDAFFKSLRTQPYQRNEPIPYAYQNDGGLARVNAVTSNALPSGKVWSLVLKPEDMNPSMFHEMAFNGISTDEIAEMRARLLLLNELPAGRNGRKSQGSSDLNDLMLLSFIRGISGRMKVPGSLFAILWEQFQGKEDQFLPLARLWAVFGLKASATVEHILELTVGPRQGNMLHVRFRGKRYKQYSNAEAAIIEVEGECDLTSKPPLEDGPAPPKLSPGATYDP